MKKNSLSIPCHNFAEFMGNLSYAFSRGKKTFQLHEECKFCCFLLHLRKIMLNWMKARKSFIYHQGVDAEIYSLFKHLMLKIPLAILFLHSISFGYFCIHFRCCSWHPRTFSFYRSHALLCLWAVRKKIAQNLLYNELSINETHLSKIPLLLLPPSLFRLPLSISNSLAVYTKWNAHSAWIKPFIWDQNFKIHRMFCAPQSTEKNKFFYPLLVLGRKQLCSSHKQFVVRMKICMWKTFFLLFCM